MDEARGLNVSVVGATGAAGREILALLEGGHPGVAVEEVRLFASARKSGRTLSFRGKPHPIPPLHSGCFEDMDLVFFSAGADVSRAWIPAALDAGARVVDCSSAFRMDPEVPLLVPEVNADALKSTHRLVANPNCVVTILVLPLRVIHGLSPLRRVLVTTYQAASGAGQGGIRELESGSRAVLAGTTAIQEVFPRSLAFNLVPQVGVFAEGGFTDEEWKIARETRKILEHPDLKISATCVRVPVFRAHSEAVYVETLEAVDLQALRAALAGFPGLELQEAPDPTPEQASGQNDVLVGRVRRDADEPRGLHFWVSGDQLLKGAALNAVQIAGKFLAST